MRRSQRRHRVTMARLIIKVVRLARSQMSSSKFFLIKGQYAYLTPRMFSHDQDISKRMNRSKPPSACETQTNTATEYGSTYC